MKRWLDSYFLSSGNRVDFLAARAIVAGNTLWLVLSRPDLPALASWPSIFWQNVGPLQRVRFLVVQIPPLAEALLYWVLVVALLMVMFGFGTRITGVVAAILLYRLAAMEPVIGSIGLLWFQGFTPLILALIIIAAASPRSRESFDDRWPVSAIRTLFALYYFFCGFEKLVVIGPAWLTASSMRTLILAQQSRQVFLTPLASTVASSAVLCWLISISTILIELGFPLVLVSRLARRILLPAAWLGHIGIALCLGLVFPDWPLLLLFVNWDALAARLRPHFAKRVQPMQLGTA
ncbi:MAG TPA: hypothetical protein VER58_00790 [Thermoanaerobaculia bacterium]|nr:hypothetical protein [Thermoanaerobaculia bacterium]